jgi:hypothetical protein
VFESINKLSKLPIAHADGVADLAPSAGGPFHFAQNPDGPVTVHPEIRRDRHQGFDRCLRTGVFRYPGFQFANALREGIDVESRGELPLPQLGMEKPMVVQMIRRW